MRHELQHHGPDTDPFREAVLRSILNVCIVVSALSLALSFILGVSLAGVVSTSICLAFFMTVQLVHPVLTYRTRASIFLGFAALLLPVNHYFTFSSGHASAWWYVVLPLAAVFFLGKRMALPTSLLGGILAGGMDVWLVHVWGVAGSHGVTSAHVTDAVFHALSVGLCGALAYAFEKRREDYEDTMLRAKKLLGSTLAHLNETNKLANIGGWSFDVSTGELWWSDQTYRIHELPVGSDVNVAEAINYYAEEARPTITKAVETAIETGVGYDLELPFVTATGRRIWVRAVGAAHQNEDGTTKLRGTFQDITELKRIADRLQETKEEAVRAARAKAQFLANMSHEIRTPMNGVIGNADLLLDDKLSPAQRQVVETIISSGQTMMQILDDILDFSKIDAGHLELDPHPCDLREQMRMVYQLFETEARDKSLTFKLEMPDESAVTVSVDSTRLRQILTNLVSNALKFTHNGEVTFSCRVLSEGASELSVRFSVTDTGIGIAEEDQGRLFKMFTQADVSTTRKFGGTGLGLAICQSLTLLLDSEIKVESSVGQGSTFFFDLTLPRTDGPVASSSAKAKDPAMPAYRVLVVEDNDTNRNLASALLKRLEVQHEVARHGEEATAMVAAQSFDMVLMDCQMPVMDGFEASRRIRKMDLSTQPLIIAMTANALASDEEASLNAGMDDHVSKPITRAKLRAMFEKWDHNPHASPKKATA